MAGFADMSVSAFLDALSSAEPTPGGGTAAAMSGAIGTSLLMMVAGLPKSRTNTDRERAALSEARAALTGVRTRVTSLADADTAAYNEVLGAYRLPKGSEEDKLRRKHAIQHALRGATEAPLEIVRAAVEGLQHARVVAQHGNPSAASDVRVALELLEAAAAGAAANVQANLGRVDDEAYRKAKTTEMMELTNVVTEHAAAARAALTTNT